MKKKLEIQLNLELFSHFINKDDAYALLRKLCKDFGIDPDKYSGTTFEKPLSSSLSLKLFYSLLIKNKKTLRIIPLLKKEIGRLKRSGLNL